MQRLVETLSARSTEFQAFWREQAVLGREGGERRFDHPPRRFFQSTFSLSSHPDVKLVTLTPL